MREPAIAWWPGHIPAGGVSLVWGVQSSWGLGFTLVPNPGIRVPNPGVCAPNPGICVPNPGICVNKELLLPQESVPF